MNRKTCLVLLALALPLLLACFLTNCGGPQENCAQAYNDDKTYRLRICTDKKEYDFGAPISITFTVTNISDEPLTLDSGNEPAMDIRVEGEYWSDGRELTPELTRITLSPGDSCTIEFVWPTARTDLEAVKERVYYAGVDVDGILRPSPGMEMMVVYVDVDYPRHIVPPK